VRQVGPLTRPGRSSLSGCEEILLRRGVLWTPHPLHKFCDGELVWSTGCTLLLVPTCEYPQPQTNDHVRFIVPHYCTYLAAFVHPAHSRSPPLGTVYQLQFRCERKFSTFPTLLFTFRCFCSPTDAAVLCVPYRVLAVPSFFTSIFAGGEMRTKSTFGNRNQRERSWGLGTRGTRENGLRYPLPVQCVLRSPRCRW
jgi:hypothetical protein